MTIYEDTTELVLGFLSIFASGAAYFAQADALPTWAQLIPHFGGLAFAVWLVIHHTTVTMPNVLKEHRQEREAMLNSFKEERAEALVEFHRVLDEKRQTYQQLLDAQSKQFAELLKEVTQKG